MCKVGWERFLQECEVSEQQRVIGIDAQTLRFYLLSFSISSPDPMSSRDKMQSLDQQGKDHLCNTTLNMLEMYFPFSCEKT